MTMVTACCKGISGSHRDKESRIQLKKAYVPVKLETFPPVNFWCCNVISNTTCRVEVKGNYYFFLNFGWTLGFWFVESGLWHVVTWFSAAYHFHGKWTCSNCQHIHTRTVRIRYFIENVIFAQKVSTVCIFSGTWSFMTILTRTHQCTVPEPAKSSRSHLHRAIKW